MSEHEREYKLAYAKQLLLTPHDPFKAAFALFPDKSDAGRALQIGHTWPADEFVKAEQQRLLSTGDARQFLPTKEAQAKAIYALTENDHEPLEDRLKAHRLYAELMGFIEKPAAGNQVNILNQGVMIVRDQGSDEQWEEKAINQQRTLIAPAQHVN